MAQYTGNDLVLYAYENLEPIGCEDSFVLNITSNEIITTTKGSGRATNREYGGYDWNVQCSGIITLNEALSISPLYFNDNIIKGKKVAIKATIGEEFYFGVGIVTSSSNTGTSGEFAKFDVTIAGDGVLYSTLQLQNQENEPALLIQDLVNGQIITSSLLNNATILMVFSDDQYIDPFDYSFESSGGNGVITFNTTYTNRIKIYYVPQ